uniref:Selenoprotein F/M domain-containing protein n=1 Tax=Cyclophora tenuis TaxID=216820 RepID=A0A7S1CUW2_CYCTE|mmetsp:Transcript_1016/g.1856  ORF Transcript_1016/g.1856 Transcript_1016/m.1856 type:complete len:139 (+) Transcript_1016:141-557(+)
MPELKQFLKGYEAEEYRGVEVEYVHGRKAVLSIFHDGELQEEITLSELGTREEMHALMVDKGFQKMSEEEIIAMQVRRRKEDAEEHQRLLEERARRQEEINRGSEERKQKFLKRLKEKEEADAKAKEEGKEGKEGAEL